MKTRQKICQIIYSILLAILISLSNIAPATAATYPLPTYSLVRKLQNKEDKIINFAEKVSRWEIIRYLILSYTNGE